MKFQARCNKRNCQARRNLKNHPLLYVTWPKCHMPGCTGKMYIDKYRMRRGLKDNAPVCRNGSCRHSLQYHRINSKGCIDYELYLSERNSKARSKNSPIPKEEWVPF